MTASSSVSTIFRCISCSFGTRDQAVYAEHIKHCGNESSTEGSLPGPVTSDDDAVQSNLSGKAKKHCFWYVCSKCSLQMDCSRELLLHQRYVHGEDLQIFACKYCTRYAARYSGAVSRHAKRKHPYAALSGKLYVEIYKKSPLPELSADNEASTDEHNTSEGQVTACDQTTHVEHVKQCSNESSTEGSLPGRVMSDDDAVQNNLSGKAKKCSSSYICAKCSVPMDSSKELLLHERYTHGEDLRIFACKFCTHYAARYISTVYRHAKSKHPKAAAHGRTHVEIHKNSPVTELSADKEASHDKHDISEVQVPACDRTTYAEQQSNKSSTEGSQPGPNDDTVQSNLSGKAKKRCFWYVCSKCSLQMDCSKDLLLHQRYVHGEDLQIFACKFCTHYAARYVATVYRHAKRKHPKLASSGRTYIEIYKKSPVPELSAEKEASTDKHYILSDDDAVQSNQPAKTKNCFISYVCTKCSVPMGCSKGLLLHQRYVHGEDLRIFACKFCTHYAARVLSSVYGHVKRRHPKSLSSGRVYVEIHKKSTIPELSADEDASADEHNTSEEQVTACDQSESITTTELHPVKSSRSLGLNFLRKQLSEIGGDTYGCQLCNFSHSVCHVVVKHIWKEHGDKVSDVTPEASVDDSSLTNALYKCDDCSYSSCAKISFYRHCAQHQFDGPSKCPHCSYRALSDGAINKHAQQYHTVQCSGDVTVKPSADQPGNICTISAPRRVAKKSGYSCHRKLYTQQKKWFTCSSCPYKTTCRSSVHYHESRVHAELNKACRKRSSSGSTGISPSKKCKKVDTGDAVEVSPSCSPAKQQKPSNDSLLRNTTSRTLDKTTCDVCLMKCSSQKHLYKHKQVHLDYRRHQCPLCGLRSNYSGNIKNHIYKVHKDNKTLPAKLSTENAKQTVVAYRKQHVMHLDIRRYQCPFCGLRSNYLGNIRTHIYKMHKDDKARPAKLSLRAAKRTIEAYRKQHELVSRRQKKHMLSSTAVKHSISSSNCKSLQYGTSTPDDHVPAISAQDSSLQVKQRKVDSSNTATLDTDFPSVRKCYTCSACKMQTPHYSSILRHIRNVHVRHGRKAKVIVVKEKKTSAQTSKLAICRQAAESQKLNAGTSGDVRDDDGSCGEESPTKTKTHSRPAEDTSVSDNVPDHSSPVGNKTWSVWRHGIGYSCDICPYKANALASLIGHRKLHVKRPGYDIACSICPYFVAQASHLERHMNMHAKAGHTVDVNAKPPVEVKKARRRNTDLKTGFYLCGHCPYMAVRPSALMYHKQLHRPRASAIYKCEKCAFWVTEPHFLCNHLRVHTVAYMKKRMEYSKLPQMSDSCGSDVTEVASEKHEVTTSHLSASGSTNEPDDVRGEKILSPGKGKLDELPQNESANDRNESAMTLSTAATAEENADVSAHVRPSAASRQLPSWCCERCPYSSSKLACFKRHVWLHGKQYRYECRYCDYSVQSYWQLVSHVLWHFAPNKHLVYAQSVSNLDSLPSQLPNRDSIPDSLASIDRFIPSFENSDVFLLSDAANFQCHHCPFVTEERSEFFAHMLCHSERAAAYSCPYCTFRTDLPEKHSVHMRMHFSLPGSRQSSLPPNLCHSDDWKRLETTIEAVAERSACSAKMHCTPADNCSSWSHDQAESTSLNTDAPVTENEATKLSDCEDDLSVAKPLSVLPVHNDENTTSTLSTAAQSADADGRASESVLTVKQEPSVTHSTVSVDSSVIEEPVSADSVTSDMINKSKFCRYCDRLIDDADALVKHEVGHRIGHPTQLVRCCYITEIYFYLSRIFTPHALCS